GFVLPGSKIFYSEADFGTITIQQITTEHFSIRYSVFSLIKKVALLIQEEAAVLRSQFILKGKIRIQSKKEDTVLIREGQFLLFNEDEHRLKSHIESNTEHQFFDAIYSYDFIQPLLQTFPSLESFIKQNDVSGYPAKFKQAFAGTPEMTKIVFDLLKCPYDENLRKLYFENRINDFLFEVLSKTLNGKPTVSKTANNEQDALFIARNLILADITKHITIKELSQKINLNQYKLKSGFKDVFGMGPFELLLQARMEKARELLLETDKPMKEIAALTGFEFLTNFIAAFRKYHGYTPGDLRRK
ncbi:MAG: helix-turn-helix transcriptional regulator, partial [Bacteroidetes bacterium]|nr:helix-turn-helix transcriptional regulator [Bacteroidota bacterium]